MELKLVPWTGKDKVVQAVYLTLNGSTIRCAAPVWASIPRGLVSADTNPFRVRVSPRAGGVTVIATAPNGVSGRIFIPGPMDLTTAAVCKEVSGVQLMVLPSTNKPTTLIRATYLSLGPSMSKCGAPLWTSDPRGVLTITKDPFVVGVKSMRPVTVIATAPNGRRGEITLKQ